MNCNDMYALSTSFQSFKYLKTLCLWNIQMDKGAFIALVSFFFLFYLFFVQYYFIFVDLHIFHPK